LDNLEYNINLEKLEILRTEFGNLYKVNNLGLPFYESKNNLINSQECIIKRGNLFILI